jgi:hypothetical protein
MFGVVNPLYTWLLFHVYWPKISIMVKSWNGIQERSVLVLTLAGILVPTWFAVTGKRWTISRHDGG